MPGINAMEKIPATSASPGRRFVLLFFSALTIHSPDGINAGMFGKLSVRCVADESLAKIGRDGDNAVVG
jgi:hypothetical protein